MKNGDLVNIKGYAIVGHAMTDYGVVLCLNNHSSHYLVVEVGGSPDPKEKDATDVVDIVDLVKIIEDPAYDAVSARLVDSFDYSATHITGKGLDCYLMALSCMIITAGRRSRSLEEN